MKKHYFLYALTLLAFSGHAYSDYIVYSKSSINIPQSTGPDTWNGDDCEDGELEQSVLDILNDIKPESYQGDSSYWCSLTSINLSNFSNIPEAIGALTPNLGSITMKYYEGTEFPSGILNLKNLTYLNADRSKLTSIPDLNGLTKLEQLRLEYNNFSTFDADSVSQLSNLKYLFIGKSSALTDITGDFSSLSGPVTSLYTFSAERTSNYNSFPEGLNCDNLRYCNVSCIYRSSSPVSYIKSFKYSRSHPFYWDGQYIGSVSKDYYYTGEATERVTKDSYTYLSSYQYGSLLNSTGDRKYYICRYPSN